ncbi:MAG: PqqD family protein [Marinilabiliales bacterium]|nr:PqqD family protein [Marinilabiliales bacterium]
MRFKKNIATSEAGFIFNPGTGDSFSANPIGSELLSLFKEEKSRKEIIETICEKYEVESIQFERDLDDFLSQLRDYNLLED